MPPFHPLTVEEYVASGVEGRTELIEGVIYDVSPRNEPHRFAVRRLAELLIRGLPTRYEVQVENALAVEGWRGKNAPEVDVAVIDRRFYEPIATAADAHALIEISDTTYDDDRKVKIPMYVHACVPAWIVNVAARRVEAYGSPDDLALANGAVIGEDGTFEILGVRVPVSALLKPR